MTRYTLGYVRRERQGRCTTTSLMSLWRQLGEGKLACSKLFFFLQKKIPFLCIWTWWKKFESVSIKLVSSLLIHCVELSLYCCFKIILVGMVKTLWSSLKTLAITMPSGFWRNTETNSACLMMIFKVNIDLCYLNHGFNNENFFYCVSINLILRLYCRAMLWKK